MCNLVFEFLSKPNLTVLKKIKYHLENSLKIFFRKNYKNFLHYWTLNYYFWLQKNL